MKYIGIRIIICIAFILSCLPSSVIAWDFSWFKKEETKIDKKEEGYIIGDSIPEKVIDEMIAKVATGTKSYMIKRTLYCESGFLNIQSNIIKNGEREDSWGIGQINLFWNNKVTKEQALDPEFSIKWMSDNWTTTKWYAYNRKTDTCNK